MIIKIVNEIKKPEFQELQLSMISDISIENKIIIMFNQRDKIKILKSHTSGHYYWGFLTVGPCAFKSFASARDACEEAVTTFNEIYVVTNYSELIELFEYLKNKYPISFK